MTPKELIRELEYLQDLGLDTLSLPEGIGTLAAIVRDAETPAPVQAKPAAPPARLATPPAKPVAAATPLPASETTKANEAPAARPLPQLRSIQLPGSAAQPPAPAAYGSIEMTSRDETLAQIREDIGDCRRCRLCQGRTNIVFGSGNEQAKLVFVGEGPGEDEDLSGLPFVGRAGQLLTKMIDGTAEKEGLPIRREHVYICNVVKCRPPQNRKPESDEMEICGQFLYRQLAVLRPKAICVLGATAAQALLATREKMGDLRGNWHKWRDIPVMVTYHPSFLLRAYSPDAKRLAWEDLKKVLHFVYDDPANLPGA